MRPRVFVTQPVAESAVERLRVVADVEVNPDSSRILAQNALIDAVRRHDILFSLLKLPNVVMTPHLGSAVVDVREAMANTVVDNILALLEGRKPPNCVNPQVFAD